MFEALFAFLGSALGVAAAPFLEQWLPRYFARKDAQKQLSEQRRLLLVDCCMALQAASLEYWNSSAEELGPRDALLSAKIVGFQHELNIVNAQIFDSAGRSFDQSTRYLGELFTACSGGDFGEPDRVRDGDRLRTIAIADAAFRSHVAQLIILRFKGA